MSQPDIAPVMSPSKQIAALMTVDRLKAAGYDAIFVRLDGYNAPAVLEGSLENARPDIVATKADTKVIIDIIDTSTEVNGARLELLASAAKLYNTKLELVVVAPNNGVVNRFKEELSRMEIEATIFPHVMLLA